jgi:hypothetical protein
MKRTLALVLVVGLVAGFAGVSWGDPPPIAQGPQWKQLFDSAMLAAHEHAWHVNKNVKFDDSWSHEIKLSWAFSKQLSGRYKNQYLLLLRTEAFGNKAYCMLMPLFDVGQFDVELTKGKLWKVVKHDFSGWKKEIMW